jgi:hypothetical protein
MGPAFVTAHHLSAHASHLFVDKVLGGGLLLWLAVTAILAFAAWAEARRLGAEVYRDRGLTPGPHLLPGRAEALDGADARPLLELTITQTGEQRRTRNGHYVVWKEVARALDERPFCLKLDDGTRLLVQTSARVDLIDRLEPPQREHQTLRRRRAQICHGDAVWIRGVVERRPRGGEGPYRGSDAPEWVLRPPAREALFLSSEPVEAPARAAARFHAACLAAGLALFAGLQTLAFGDYRQLRSDPEVVTLPVAATRAWTTTHKGQVREHYAISVAVPEAGGAPGASVEQETTWRAYTSVTRGLPVVVTRSRSHPKILQLGDGEVGASADAVTTGMLLTVFAGAAQIVVGVRRRPWWRRRRVVDCESGKL